MSTQCWAVPTASSCLSAVALICEWRKGKNMSGALASGVAVSLADSSLLPLWKSLLAVPPWLLPGWAARTTFPWPVAPKVCFLQAGICRKDWCSHSPPCSQRMCFAALASWECVTLRHCLKGTFPPEVRLGLHSYSAKPCLWEIPSGHIAGRLMGSTVLAMFLSAPYHSPPFMAEPEASGKFVLRWRKMCDVLDNISSSLTLKCVKEIHMT